MCRKFVRRLALLCAIAATAGAQDFLLDLRFSELITPGSVVGPPTLSAATDSAGNIYILADNGLTFQQAGPPASYVLKLTSTGNELVYQTPLTFYASFMAVDRTGYVYLLGYDESNNATVEKLGTDGSTVVYESTLGYYLNGLFPTGIAVDKSGRLYIAGSVFDSNILKPTPGAFQQTPSTSVTGYVIRMNASGGIDYATYLGDDDYVTSIAVDNSGSAFITGVTLSADFPTTAGAYLRTPGSIEDMRSFVSQLSSDGSALVYSTFTDTLQYQALSIALDAEDDATIALLKSSGPGYVIMRFNPQGNGVLFAENLPATSVTGLQIDSSGNTYVGASVTATTYPVKNSLAACSAGTSQALTVFDPNGNILQSTYLLGIQTATGPVPFALALAGFNVDVVGLPGQGYTATQQLAGSSNGSIFLTQLYLNHNAKTVPLVCVENAASFDNTAISPGEIVTLFGTGIGPASGVNPQVTLASGFPTELANVKVTFNGTPGPLLYVQNDQINAIAPWSLQVGQTVPICVTYNDATTNCVNMPVIEAHPGVFTVDGNYAAALNQDGTVNSASNPAHFNTIVSVFATGLGAISPAQPDGSIVGFPLPDNVLRVTAQTFLGVNPPLYVPLTVYYAGPAPFEVAGFSQINIGLGIPATITANQISSNAFNIYVVP